MFHPIQPRLPALILALTVTVAVTGCTSFLAEHAMQTYPVKSSPSTGSRGPTGIRRISSN